MTTHASAAPLRVLLGVPWYFPDSVGGTEVYVRGLAAGLRRSGVEVAIAAPTAASTPTEYVHDGVTVFRYPAPYAGDGEIDLARAEPVEWRRILDAFTPAVVDLHALTSGLELAHVKSAKQIGARVLVTLHIPGVICARGTFMRFGEAPCSGDIAREPCTACRLEVQGVPTAVGRVLGSVPRRVAGALDHSAVPPGVRRAATAGLRDDDRREWLGDIIALADRIVAPSAWLVDVLLRNGAPRDRVLLCRQGIDAAHLAPRPVADREPGPMRVGFVGRFDPVKGVHVLVDAAALLPPTAAIEVHVWGSARSPVEEAYRQAMVARAQSNRRVIFHEETADPASVYRAIDVLAVPSVWLETGPLVVLEAQAAGVPVVGSNIGGIAERVTDGVDGLLVPFGDAAALAHALMTLASDPHRRQALRPVHPPRTMVDVTRDTLRTYEQLTAAHAV